MNENIYEVTRQDYKAYVQTLNKKMMRIEEKELNRYHRIVKIYSLLTNKCLCSRVFDIRDASSPNRDPEKYYIFEIAEAEESLPPVPTYRLELQTKKEVQKFFDFLSEQNKKNA